MLAMAVVMTTMPPMVGAACLGRPGAAGGGGGRPTLVGGPTGAGGGPGVAMSRAPVPGARLGTRLASPSAAPLRKRVILRTWGRWGGVASPFARPGPLGRWGVV